jgi:hypothetical protein
LTAQDPRDLPKDELMRYARALEVPGRSRMKKAELVRAIRRASR